MDIISPRAQEIPFFGGDQKLEPTKGRQDIGNLDHFEFILSVLSNKVQNNNSPPHSPQTFDIILELFQT